MKTQYLRLESTIFVCSDHSLTPAKDEDGNPVVHLDAKSINKAKKESRRLQQANGGLGRGYVAVI